MTTTKPRTATALLLVLVAAAACGSAAAEKKDSEYFTSGSRDADQRAEQTISRSQQLRGEADATGKSGTPNQKPTLYERLGGGDGVMLLVDDFVNRALADPRVNWERRGVKRGGVLGIGGTSAEWQPTAKNIERLKEHMRQFIAVATGGPTKYEGRDIGELHKGMGITNAEFDATIGDLKASLDALHVGIEEQKELLAVLESARPQVSEER